MRGSRMACVLVVLAATAAAPAARAQDAVEWFQKAVYTTNPDEQVHDYQKALEVDPGYTQAQHNLASVYYRKGLFRKSIAMYETLIRGGHAYYQTFYDLACCYARVGDNEHAVKALTRSFQKGFKDRKLIDRDEDLAAVRATPDYQRLAARYLAGRAIPVEPTEPPEKPLRIAKAPKATKKAKKPRKAKPAPGGAASGPAIAPVTAGVVLKK